MPSATYSIDGIAMNHPLGNWYVLDDIPVGLAVERRSSDLFVQGRNGSVGTYDETDEISQLGLVVVVNAVGVRTVNDSYQALKSILTKRTDFLTLRRTLFGTTSEAKAKLLKLVEPKLIATADSFTFTIVLVLPGVYFRDTADLTWTQSAPVSGTTYRVTTFDNTTTDIRDAKIKLTGPMTSPVLKDEGSGTSFSVGTVAAGRQVLVNADTGYVYESASSSAWNLSGSDISAQLRTAGVGSGLRVISFSPSMTSGDPFDRRVNVTLTATNMTASSKLEIQGRRCFF